METLFQAIFWFIAICVGIALISAVPVLIIPVAGIAAIYLFIKACG